MIDSTNPRIIADNIKKLFEKIGSIPIVQGNPTGTGFNTLLTKIKIGSVKYKLPANVTANPEGAVTGSLAKIGIGSDIYSTGSTAYSTSEEVIGEWIDGSPLYEKTYNLTKSDFTKEANGKYTYDPDIANLNKTINMEGILQTSNYGVCVLGGSAYTSTSNTQGFDFFNFYNKVIALDRGRTILDDDASWTAIVTIRYTKTES